MPHSPYSFLDVVALDDVRAAFASGETMAILSADLEQLIWANGPGAALFGQDSVEAAIGAPSGLAFPARRQIMSTRGFPDIGAGRPVIARVGVVSLPLLASAVVLPDGEKGILLRVGRGQDAPALPQAAVTGFGEPGHHVALLRSDLSVEAATPGFAQLALEHDDLAQTARTLATTPDRIARRMLRGAGGALPAGMVRLEEEPARFLLVVIDDLPKAATEATDDDPVRTGDVGGAGAASATSEPTDTVDAADEADLAASEAGTGMAEAKDAAQASTAADIPGAGPDLDQEVLEEAQGGTGVGDGAGAGSAAVESASFEGGPDLTQQPLVENTGTAQAASLAESTAAALPSMPIRFVWRTDADGRFREISRDFTSAFGLVQEDIVGRDFEALAADYGLDRSGEVAGLLARRDTWSGRTVDWPIEGTDMRVPVDLAGLPVYSRDRTFEGFRGFGVARTNDAFRLGPAETMPSDVSVEAAVAAVDAPAGPALPDGPGPATLPDKVVRLAEHRNDKGLSTGERNIFREIGERLKRATGVKRDEAETAGQDFPDLETATEPDASAQAASRSEPAFGIDGSPDEAARRAEAEEPVRDLRVIEAAMLPFDEPALDADDEGVSDDGTADLLRLDGADDAGGQAPEHAPSGDEADAGEPSAASSQATPDRSTAWPAVEPIDQATLQVEPNADEPTEHVLETQGERTGRKSMSLLGFSRQQADGTGGSIGSDRYAEAGASFLHAPVSLDGLLPFDGEDEPVSEEKPSERREIPGEQPEVPGEQRDGSDEPVAGASGSAAIEPHAEMEPAEAIAANAPPPSPRAPEPLPSALAAAFARDAAGPLPSARPETTLLEKLPVPILVHTGDTVHYANEEFLAFTGYVSLEAFRDAGGIGALFVDGEEGAPENGALCLQRADGQSFPVEAFLQSVPWNGGKALLLVLSLPKDDGRPQGQSPLTAELEARVAEMRTIIDTATDGVVLMSRDGMIRSISRPAEALFGFDSAIVAGKPFVSLFAIESQRAARDYLTGLSENGVASVLNDGCEVIGREAEGRFIPLFMTIGRLPGESGYCAVVRDITQWKRAEEDLTQARALAERSSSHKSEFLARVSHEIRTPLNAIIGFSELMMDEKFGPIANDRYRDYLRDINRSGNHVLDLVNDLLDISKIEAGQQEMAYEAVALNDTLAETVAMMQPQANRERVIIRSSFGSKLPEVVADLRSVRQIAINILSNAIRYTQAGGQVIVSTSYETSGDVVMRVRDTGVGMSPAEIEQALKPFKQINSLKRSRGDGTGLGLPLTKALVEANRARFSIVSTPGEGTLVEVSFPSTRVLAQ